jgi:hypothetical protein
VAARAADRYRESITVRRSPPGRAGTVTRSRTGLAPTIRVRAAVAAVSADEPSTSGQCSDRPAGPVGHLAPHHGRPRLARAGHGHSDLSATQAEEPGLVPLAVSSP